MKSLRKKVYLLISFTISLVVLVYLIFTRTSVPFMFTNNQTHYGMATNLVEIGNAELSNILENSGATFIYIGRPTCPICARLEPILNDVLYELDMSLYYYNTDKSRQEDAIGADAE